MRLFALLLLAGCVNANTVDVTDYGATPDDSTDDRAAIQAAIDAAAGGGTVYIPSGVYILGQYSTVAWSLDIGGIDGLRIVGEPGTVLMLAAGSSPSVRLISSYSAPCANITIERITFDGNKANQSVDEQRHGLFLGNASNVTIRDVEARNFTGDGLYFYDGNTDILVDNARLVDNDRNGLTLGGSNSVFALTNSLVSNNAAQQFDSEAHSGDSLNDISITANTFEGSGGYYAVTLGGVSDSLGKGWMVTGNRVKSGENAIRVIYADDILLANNIIESGNGAYAGIEVYNQNRNVVITGNSIKSPNQGTNGGISVIGTTDVLRTDQVTITGNVINTEGGAVQTGIRVQGARYTSIIGNQVTGDGGTSGGIVLRATFDMPVVMVSGNMTNSLNTGIHVAADVTGRVMELANISKNTALNGVSGIKFSGYNLTEVCLSENQTYGVTYPVVGSPNLCE